MPEPRRSYHYHAIDKAGVSRAVWATFGMCQLDWEEGLRIVGCEKYSVYVCTYRRLAPADIERIDQRLGFPWVRRR
jgi:hypothetical protein